MHSSTLSPKVINDRPVRDREIADCIKTQFKKTRFFDDVIIILLFDFVCKQLNNLHIT